MSDNDIELPGERGGKFRMRNNKTQPTEELKPVATEPGTIARFQRMLTEANQIWSENQAQFIELSKTLPKTGLNTSPQTLCILFYMANRAEKARARRR